MKRLILISALLLTSFSLFSQSRYYYQNRYKKDLTFQVSADVINYDGMKYGWSLGANYKEIFSLSYFHTRDYESTETSWMDSRFGGLHGSAVVPLNNCIQIGASVRMPYLNRGSHRQGEKLTYAAEVRMDLGLSTKIVLEHGLPGSNSITALRLVWNIY